MVQIADLVGNPAALLIERIFWLGLGAFFCLAILNSILRNLRETKVQKKILPSQELIKLAEIAKKQNV